VSELWLLMNNKLLSICILSYNQADEVERLLNSVMPQMTDDVEIVVRDDSTDNETELLIARYSDVFPIRYFHGEKGGIDKTIIFLSEEAKGEFVWWLGDDEITPGSIQRVLAAIRENGDLSFIWANYTLIKSEKIAISLPKDQIIEDCNRMLELGGVALGFISATICRRELLLTGIEESKQYDGTLFVNLYLVLHVICQPGKLLYMKGPIVICHNTTPEEFIEIAVDDSGVINNWSFQVFALYFSEIIHAFPSFSPSSMEKVIKESFGYTWRGVLVGYVGGWDTPHNKRLIMLKHFGRFPEAWLAFFLFCFPRWLLGIMYRVYKILKLVSMKLKK